MNTYLYTHHLDLPRTFSYPCFITYQLPSPVFIHSTPPIFIQYFIYLFLEAEEGREKERERNISAWLPLVCPLLGTWSATQACALTGNRISNLLVCRMAINPLSYTSQATTAFSSNHLLMVTWAASKSWLLQIVLQ